MFATASTEPGPAWWSRIRMTLESDHLCWLTAFVATLLMLPSLGAGLFHDDYLQKRWIAEQSAHDSWNLRNLDLFNFSDEATQPVQSRIESGEFPWWTHPKFRLHFYRPLAAATHWLDYQLWGDQTGWMHLQNIGWYALAVFAITRLLQQMSEQRWSGGLAAVFYAANATHSFAVTWLASRNAIMTICFLALALRQHHRWRVQGAPASRSLTWALIWQALALMSGESAIVLTGWLLAFALLLDRSTWQERVRSVLPTIALSLIWLVMHRLAGLGMAHSGLYTDPIAEPARFFWQFCERAPVLLGSVFGFCVADLYSFASEETRAWLLLSQVLVVLLLFVVIMPLARHDRMLLFWTLCTLMTLIPMSGTLPMDRLLLVPSLTARGLQARFFELLPQVLRARKSALWFRLTRGLAVWWLIWHVPHGVAMLPLRTIAFVSYTHIYGRAPADPQIPDLAQRRVVLVNPPDPFYAWYFSDIRRANGRDLPERVHLLATGITPLEIVRSDANTIVLHVDGDLLANPISTLYRNPRERLATTPIVTQGLTIQPQRFRPDGQPDAIEFHFDVPCDDASLVWLTWHDGRYAVIDPPRIGERMHIDRAVPWNSYHLGQIHRVLGLTAESEAVR